MIRGWQESITRLCANVCLFFGAIGFYGYLLIYFGRLDPATCFELSDWYHSRFLPACCLSAFLLGAVGASGPLPAGVPLAHRWPGVMRIARLVVSGTVAALAAWMIVAYYTQVGISHFARASVVVQTSVAQVWRPPVPRLGCSVYVRLSGSAGSGPLVCVVRRGVPPVLQGDPGELVEGRQVRVIGRSSSFGSVADRIELV
jgi:hypothetical protein